MSPARKAIQEAQSRVEQLRCLNHLTDLKRLHNEAAMLARRVFPEREDMPECFQHMDAFTNSLENIILARLHELLEIEATCRKP
jgi:hypothetical protein